MKRAMRCVGALFLILAACGGEGSTESTTTTTPDTSTLATSTTLPASTSTTTMPKETTSPPTTVPGSYAVDYEGYCVRGTDPTDRLNVRTGPGADHDIVGSLAFNATDIAATGERLRGMRGVTQVTPFGSVLHVTGRAADLLEAALAPLRGDARYRIERIEPTLEDVFISLMARSAENPR